MGGGGGCRGGCEVSVLYRYEAIRGGSQSYKCKSEIQQGNTLNSNAVLMLSSHMELHYAAFVWFSVNKQSCHKEGYLLTAVERDICI